MQLRTTFFAVVTALFSVAAGTHTAAAQAIPTAYKTGTLDAFFLYGRSNTDYGPVRNNVMSFGGNYLFAPRGFGQPGVNVRYARSTGEAVNQTFFGGGLDLRFQVHYHVRPYILVDYGVGSLKQNQGTFNDSGNTLLMGGGADIPITQRIAARAEFTYQHLSIAGGKGPDLTFTPTTFSLGVVYQIR